MVRTMRPAVALMLLCAASLHSAIEEARVRQILVLREKKVPAAVVAYLDERGAHVVAHSSPGLNRTALSADSVFEIGSVTKVFTGILLAEMVERGEVALDDPVVKYLPEGTTVPLRNGKPITLASLVTQSSGLPRLPPNLRPADGENPYADYTEAQLYAGLGQVKLAHDPFAHYEYSNFGMGLLGNALARRAGKSYFELLRERVLKPLGMNDTAIELSADQHARLVPGFTATLNPAKNWDLPALAGAGALRSTANDMLKLLGAMLGRRDLPGALGKALKRSIEPMLPAGEAMEIGMAWHILKRGPPAIIWHNGGTGGYRSWCGFAPETKTAVVVLSNTALSVDDIGLHLLNSRFRLADHRPNSARRELLQEEGVLARHVGRYRLSPSVVIIVTLEEGRLHLQATGDRKVRLYADGPNRYFGRDAEIQVEFGAAGLVLRGPSGSATADKLP